MRAEGLRVLVTDGSSLAARQAITALGMRGAAVEVVDPGPIPLARFSRFVRRTHRVPRYGRDPWGWLDATLRVLTRGQHEVLFAVHEQTALLSLVADRVRDLGAGLAVPPFEAVRRVQDKWDAYETLAAAGLRQPRTALEALDPPVYVKARIGTASAGVARADDRAALRAGLERLGGEGAVLFQEPVPGPLAMVQSVFDRGRLVAHHANLRVREGAEGGASHKESVAIVGLAGDLERLGRELGWHGALSLDAILTPEGPVYIDVNPRLVEPANAQRAGVDLVGALVGLALGRPVARQRAGAPGVRTHQLLIALLGAAQRGEGRRGLARELLRAARHVAPYDGSTEELTPARHDWPGALPVVAVAGVLLADPGSHSWFSGGAVANYSLTAEAWREIVSRA
jgi:hypothetical protein